MQNICAYMIKSSNKRHTSHLHAGTESQVFLMEAFTADPPILLADENVQVFESLVTKKQRNRNDRGCQRSSRGRKTSRLEF